MKTFAFTQYKPQQHIKFPLIHIYDKKNKQRLKILPLH